MRDGVFADAGLGRHVVGEHAAPVHLRQRRIQLLRVVFDSTGRLFGTAYAGGAHEDGLVFNLGHASVLSWYELVLHAFDGTDGNAPAAI